jgi:hypothetical protein
MTSLNPAYKSESRSLKRFDVAVALVSNRILSNTGER